MKKLLKLSALAAIAATALVSCKEEPFVPEQPGEVHITVKAVPQDFANETRTYINDNNTIIWGTGEYMKIAVKAGETTKFGDSSENSADAFNGEAEALFEFSITPEGSAPYTYMGLYPASAAVSSNNTNPEKFKVKLPDVQNATASSYDPAAYIMVAKPEPFNEIQTLWEAYYRRATALNQVTLTGIADDIVSVDFIAADNVKFAGGRHIDLTSGESTDIYDGQNVVSVKYATALPASADNKVIWFTSWDTEIAAGAKLKIVAKSATKSYTREITANANGIKFKEGYLNKLSINMSNAEEEDINSLAGNYVILAKKDASTYFALKGEASGSRIASADYSGSLDIYEGTDESLVWTIAASGTSYTIENRGNFVGWSSGNYADLIAEEDYDATKCLMGIDENTDGTYKIYVSADNTRILARNTSNAYFAFYAGTQYKDIVLVPTAAREPLNAPTFVIASLNSDVSNAIDVSFDDEVAGAASYVITATPQVDGEAVIKDGITASPATIDGLAYNTPYIVTVHAVPATNDLKHKQSPATEASEPVTTGAKPAVPEGYELVSSIDNVTSGRYVIAVKIEGKYYAMSNVFGDKISGTEVSVNNNVINKDDAEGFVVTLNESSSKFTIKGNGNQVLGYKSGTDFDSNATEGSNAAQWTIASASVHGSFSVSNVGTNTRGLIWQAGTTNKFGAYAISNLTATSIYYNVELFKFNGVVKNDPTTTVTPASPISIEVGNTQQLTVSTNSDGAVSYESSNTGIATVSNSGLITAIAAGSATITVTTAETNTYYSGSKEVSVTVTNGPSSIADVITAAENASVYTSGVVAQVNLKGFVITDGTDNILVYYSSGTIPTVTVGQSVVVTGKRGIYNGVPQIKEPTTTPGATGQTVTRTPLTTITSSNATGQTSCIYASLTGTLTQNGNYYNISISDSSTQGSLYQVSSTAEFSGGALASLVNKVVTVTGYVVGSAENFLYIAAVDIIPDPNAPSISISPATTSSSPASWPADNADAKTFTVNATNGTWDYQATDMDWATISRNGNVLTVTPLTAQATDNYSGTITVTLTATGYSNLTETIYLSQAKYGSDTFTDLLTADCFTATAQTYSDFNNVIASGTSHSSARYAGNSALSSNGGIQLRSKNANSGIVVTNSGGKAKSIKFTIESGSNQIDVYGKNTAYTSAADLYSSSTQGTKIGSVSDSGTITISSDYKFIGIRSNSGAVYITSIEIVWEN